MEGPARGRIDESVFLVFLCLHEKNQILPVFEVSNVCNLFSSNYLNQSILSLFVAKPSSFLLRVC
jgi:hypothetical protein